MGLPYEEFVKIQFEWQLPMWVMTFVYTFILGAILLTVTADVANDANKLDCQEYMKLWYTNGSDTNG